MAFNSTFDVCVALHVAIMLKDDTAKQGKITQAATRIKERKALTMVVLREKVVDISIH